MTPEQELIIKQFAMSSARPTSHLIEYVNSIIATEVEMEREACAALCDAMVNPEYATGKVDHNEAAWTFVCASAIRARSKP